MCLIENQKYIVLFFNAMLYLKKEKKCLKRIILNASSFAIACVFTSNYKILKFV
jgi:hypothetical protein